MKISHQMTDASSTIETGAMKLPPWQLTMLDKALKKRQKLSALKKHLRDLPGKRCLLVTCGDNNGAMNYRIREWGGDWVWAELEDAHIKTIESLLQEPVTAVNKLDCRLLFPDGSFDRVVTIDCHEHLKEPDLLNAELYRVTKANGSVIVTVPNGNRRKLAVRMKELVGMTQSEYGHVVTGYEIPALRRMLQKAGLKPHSSSSYSKFFTEIIELGINFVYVKILASKGTVVVDEGSIAPTTQEQFNSVNTTYKIYSIIFPFLWTVSQLDRLLHFNTGYAVIVEARKV
jgi:ubiquinone/menaquinone biosynthesis C-methylase UbiE